MENLLGVFAVYDMRAEMYNTPFYQVKPALALRAFEGLCKDGNTTVARHPADFKMVQLGWWSPVTGVFKALESVETLAFATDFAEVERVA